MAFWRKADSLLYVSGRRGGGELHLNSSIFKRSHSDFNKLIYKWCGSGCSHLVLQNVQFMKFMKYCGFFKGREILLCVCGGGLYLKSSTLKKSHFHYFNKLIYEWCASGYGHLLLQKYNSWNLWNVMSLLSKAISFLFFFLFMWGVGGGSLHLDLFTFKKTHNNFNKLIYEWYASKWLSL